MKSVHDYLTERVSQTKPTQYKLGDYLEGGTIVHIEYGLAFVLAPKEYFSEPLIFNSAVKYCEKSTIDGYGEWRIPRRVEARYYQKFTDTNKEY